MECSELEVLRREATTVFKDLTLRRRRAHEYAAANASGSRLISGLVRRGDFEAYLQRRLGKTAARIEAHKITHGCQT